MPNEVQKQPNQVNALKAYLESPQIIDALNKALPKYLTTDKLLSVALSEVRKTPKLLNCSQISFANAMIQCAQLGLMPGSSLGQMYLIPYGEECTVMPGYRGYVVLARRSRTKTIIKAHCIYENDIYRCNYGSVEEVMHQPALQNRGKIIGAYAVATDNNGDTIIDQLSLEDIEKARACSKCPDKVWGPWYDEQARKTAVRRVSKYLDLSSEFSQLKDIDDGNVIEGAFNVEPEQPEKPQNQKMLDKMKNNGKKEDLL